MWIIWRGNALMSSAKGHEYFLKHYLGTHTNSIAPETAEEFVKEVKWHKEAPQGKLDLVVDINFRMDTSALYSDIVLPTATWYEKDDLNTTDMHSFIHPMQEAVPPCWEAKSDWDIFKGLAQKVSELAKTHLPEPVREIVSIPLQHDTPAAMAQFEIKDWSKGECEPIPGKTMPGLVVVERDYKNLYNRFISLGPEARKGIGAHGISWPVEDYYDEMAASDKSVTWGDKSYPTLSTARDAAEVILKLAPETNGEMGFRAFAAAEQKVGLPLTDLAAATRGVRTTFADLERQPRRLLNSPIWSGLTDNGRAYAPFCINTEKLVPWRTLSGRQHFYLDHQGYIAAGEHLPTYKPKPDHSTLQDFLVTSTSDKKSIMLNYLSPHGKWGIHSTYSDNHHMLTLSRGCHPFWLNDQDAAQIGVFDNDWVEAYNDHGVVVTRAIVTSRLPRGIAFLYHAMERTGVPKSPLRGNKRAGGNNSLNRIRLKPNLMLGGYGQFTYAWNYWGPTGANRDSYIMVRKLDGEPQW
ncbi:MAG: molybdopterin-dependent oxidoreductase [Desulfuromonas sp.]